MNVIVSNRQKEIIDNANIDAIKDLNGLFNVNDLINKFKNYFFSKMILDATSVVDFATKDVLTTLANEIGAEKLIILLPSNPEPPMEFKKLLIDLKIYNFTNNIDDVVKFIETPNTYEDAMKLIDGSYTSDVYVDNSIKDQEEVSSDNNMDIDNITDEDISMEDANNTESLGDILSRFNLNNSNANSNNNIPSVQNDMGINIGNNNVPFDQMNTNYNVYNEPSLSSANDSYDIMSRPTPVPMPTGNTNTFLISDDFDNTSSKPQKIIIGIKNITVHAGATSLIYMLHKMAVVNLKKSVLSIEIGKNDFRLFRDNNMVSANANDVMEIINNSHEEVVFVDLNEYDGTDVCNEVLYLVEPSTIKLNGLMAVNRNIFTELKGRKVLLNKSLLSPSDIRILEGEAGLQFFFSVEPLNDRIFNDTISKLLNLLGIK